MFLSNAGRDREPKPCASLFSFGGKERVAQTGDIFSLDTTTLVVDLHVKLLLEWIITGGDGYSFVIGLKRLASVDDQIDHYLFNALGIALKARHILSVLNGKVVGGFFNGVIYQANSGGNDPVEIDRFAEVRRALAGKIPEIVDDPANSMSPR